MPPIPELDPSSAILADPQVPENRRFCGACERPVGRGRDGVPGLAEGFCRNCGTAFSFIPKLLPGDLVGGQYEVLGCLAHGGLGWIYLARDRNVSDSWRVLKGLLNTGDADAMAAAVAERQFLAAVDHPNIVRIYNFVQHADSRTGENAGYIVMEYVGGKSLKQILADQRTAGRSVPLAHALAYAIEVLPALGYLHGRGLVYCDFKPDNVIQSEEQLKLIDMGGVRRIDDEDSPIYGTVGYQAPEIAADGPSPSSDLYTVGRALAVLTFDFPKYQSTYATTLPDRADVSLLAQQESFWRLLRRATDPDPDARFATATEMAVQAVGVLREVLAVADGVPRPAFSQLFSPEVAAVGAATAADADDATARIAPPSAAEVVAGLPVPQVDADRPGGRLPGHAEHTGPGSADRRADRRRHRPGRRPARGGPVRRNPAGPDPVPDRDRRPERGRHLAVRAGQHGPGRLAEHLVRGPAPARGGQPGRRRGGVRRGVRRAARRAGAQAGPGPGGRGGRRPRLRGPLLRAGVDGGPVLRQRGVRPGPGAAGGRGPARRDRRHGRRARHVQLPPGGPDRRGPDPGRPAARSRRPGPGHPG